MSYSVWRRWLWCSDSIYVNLHPGVPPTSVPRPPTLPCPQAQSHFPSPSSLPQVPDGTHSGCGQEQGWRRRGWGPDKASVLEGGQVKRGVLTAGRGAAAKKGKA